MFGYVRNTAKKEMRKRSKHYFEDSINLAKIAERLKLEDRLSLLSQSRFSVWISPLCLSVILLQHYSLLLYRSFLSTLKMDRMLFLCCFVSHAFRILVLILMLELLNSRSHWLITPQSSLKCLCTCNLPLLQHYLPCYACQVVGNPLVIVSKSRWRCPGQGRAVGLNDI